MEKTHRGRPAESIEYYNQALAKDPNYALAYTGLAASYTVLGNSYLPPNETFPKAKAYATKALELDGTLADAHVVWGQPDCFTIGIGQKRKVN